MNEFQQSLQKLKIVPVVTPYTIDDTLKMTAAMKAGGINCVEVTLRTECAWEAIAELQKAELGVQIGIGTITSAELFIKAAEINPDFIVSPGITPQLLATAQKIGTPFLPGIATASELMMALEFGFSTCKLFPAMTINGESLLSAFSGPFTEVKFCPTGGVNAENAGPLLAKDNVVCVGGSWMIPKQLVQNSDWAAITELSRQAMEVTAP